MPHGQYANLILCREETIQCDVAGLTVGDNQLALIAGNASADEGLASVSTAICDGSRRSNGRTGIVFG